MTTQIKLRPQRVTDAKRFFEILSNPKFIYFYSIPKTLQDEIDYLKGNAKRRKENIERRKNSSIEMYCMRGKTPNKIKNIKWIQ